MGETTPHDRSLAEDATDDAGDPPEEEDDDISMNTNNLRVSEEDGLDLLNRVVLHDAISNGYDGYPPPDLLLKPSTLVEQNLKDWVDNPTPSSRILWLSVSKGLSKSAAARKVVEHCQASNRFVASFFFHSEKGYDQGRGLFPTIAYQLANNLEDLRAPINRIVLQDRSLLDQDSIGAQFQSLIVRPFQESTSIPLLSAIVVIVGLEEYNEKQSQLEILDLIASAVTKYQLPLRFLISTRSEPYFETAFGEEPLKDCSRIIKFSDNISIATESSAPSDLLHSHSDSASHPFLRRLLPSVKSRRGRISHTHRRAGYMDSFPRLVTIESSNGRAESYSRSLMMKGHGFPLWYPGGDLGKPIEYLQKGVSIGDVGVLDRDGLFDFCFNIFLPPDDPKHSHLAPEEFKPIEGGLDPSEVHTQPDYFKPGSVITSKGVTVTRRSESPLDISFSSTEQEGGIIILPDGAFREDMINTDRIHEYAKRHAPYWYQDVNGYGGVVHTNGSLFLVTGCDKANDWAIASFPYYSGTKTQLDLQYTQQPDFGPPWVDHSTARTDFYAPSTSKSIPTNADSRHQCIFVRGMRISLSLKSWNEAMPVTQSARLYYSYILHTPTSLELLMNTILICLRLRLSERRAMKKVTPSRLQLFHPNFVIGQVLLQRHPDSEVALVDDSVWCSLTHESLCTISEVNELVTAVFNQNDVVEKDGNTKLSMRQ
ncbi:hypothetical protein BJ912DRAFT_995275 [Pholiota molesta]|nr:hypothetical protein BJ912DRAFT_995275 [Pholiota molesta]